MRRAMSIPDLSIWRLLLISSGWVVISVAAILWKTNRMLAETMASDLQQRGIAAVSTSVGLLAGIVLGPPTLLVIIWLLFKQRAS